MKLLIPLCLILLFFSCDNNSGLNGPLVINDVNKIRQQETLSDSEISIHFDEVTEDSRCPEDVYCFWEGNAKIKFTLTIKEDNVVIPFELYSTEMTPLQMKSDTILSDYRVEVISLFPYPEANERIPQASYTAEIRVEKKNSLSRN